MAFEISEDHLSLLRTVLGLDKHLAVPRPALELFEEISRSRRRVGYSMTSEVIALIPVLLNRVVKPEPDTFLDLPDVAPGARVVAKFRNKYRAGVFVKIEKDRVLVAFDDDSGEVRKLGPTFVRLASNEDLKKIG